MLPVIRTNDGFTTVVNGVAYNVNKSHNKFNMLLKAVRENNVKLFLDNYTLKEHKVEVDPQGMYLDGVKLHNVLAKRTVEMLNEGYNVDNMKLFLKNILKNPSEESRNELYEFLEHKCLPITEDGCFLAYKVVDSKFYSKTAGNLQLVSGSTLNNKIYNFPGEKIRCKREDVDGNRSHECSYGLHAGALAYAGPGGTFYQSGDKVVLVKINPADVVSVPKDYNATKIRVCAYEVLSEYKQVTTPVVTATGGKVARSYEYIDPRDLVEYDVISFKYNGVDRNSYLVEKVYSNKVLCVENHKDVEDFGSDPVYKSFVFDRMSNVVVE